MNKTADIKRQLLAIMNENLSAMIRAKKGKMKGVLKNNDPFDCVIETYQDLISIINNLPLKGTVPQSMADRINDTAGVNAGVKWVKASERLPKIEGKKCKPVFVNAEIGKYGGGTYVSKRVAYYFPEHFKNIEWEDWDDYSEENFPYTEDDKERECVWLRPGWYESVNCDNCEWYWSSPINVIEWLDEGQPAQGGKP